MANQYNTIDASGMESVDYATYLADYFAAMTTTTRGATTYYDSTFYEGLGYYTGSQLGVRYAGSTNGAQVLMEGAAMQYDGIDGVNHGSYSGSVDSVTFGFFDANTMSAENGSARSTLIGVIEELVISGLDISEAVGAGSGADNDFFQLMTALRDGNSATTGAAAIDKLYEMFAFKAQHFIGSDGDDTYVGTNFADKIEGGAGFDTLSGGKGKDHFVFDLGDTALTAEGADIILDFNRKQDRIDLSGIDANPVKAGDQAFKFFGDADFSGRVGQVVYETTDTQTIVSVDVDGNSAADLIVVLDGVFKLTADSFVL